MTELNTEKLINETNDDELKCMLSNIYTYKDMDEYTRYTNTTKEDLECEQEEGFILDITPRTYNGALDKTDYNELTTANIYSALLEDAYDYYFQELLEDIGESSTSESQQVRLVTDIYRVFTIGQHLYIDYD